MVVASARRRASAWAGVGTDEQISGLYVAVDEEILVQMRQACELRLRRGGCAAKRRQQNTKPLTFQHHFRPRLRSINCYNFSLLNGVLLALMSACERAIVKSRRVRPRS